MDIQSILKVRDKMILASSRLLVKKQLGENRFCGEWTLYDSKEVNRKGYEEWQRQQQHTEKPYTAAELELQKVKEEHQKLQNSSAIQLTPMHEFTCSFTEQASIAIQGIPMSETNLIRLVGTLLYPILVVSLPVSHLHLFFLIIHISTSRIINLT